MLFNSHIFIFAFLPLTLFAFFLIARWGRREPALACLVVASFVFYGWWNPSLLPLLAGSIAFNYAIGLGLRQARSEGRERRLSQLLVLGVAGNLALLGTFKYANFFVETANDLTDLELVVAAIPLPLAISFFTFQQIAYLVDVRRGVTAERSFLRYCLFVSFFPQLIAGPIVHHKEMLPQFDRADALRLRVDDFAIGLTTFAIGLFKKTMIADSAARIADRTFAAAEQGAELAAIDAWAGVFAFSLQIYFDFSGYSDMAIGLARLFGIRLPLNFDAPYRATSIIDFWRRWHMTLSRFLRDYLYIPLGGNRRGPSRRLVNVMITMLLGGLWHGAGWTFVVWGGLHGLMLVLNQLWRSLVPVRIDRWWSRFAARAATFLAVSVTWIFFRAESFDGALVMLRGLVDLASLRPEPDQILWAAFWMIFLWTLPTTQQLLVRFRPALDFPGDRIADWQSRPAPAQRLLRSFYWRPSPAWAGVIAVVCAVGILRLSRVKEFLYFQF